MHKLLYKEFYVYYIYYIMNVHIIFCNNSVYYSVYYLLCSDVNQHFKYKWQNDT